MRDLAIFSIVAIILMVLLAVNPTSLTGAAIREACFDSDPGQDFYVKGHAEYGKRKWEDVCSSDGVRLIQSYCKSSVQVARLHTYQCPYGCKNGVCIGRESNCGNGNVDLGEVCDDGNSYNGDGCSNSCTKEPGFSCKTISVCNEGS